MRAKTIKAILRKRFDNFLKSINDGEVRDLVANNSIITGGSIVSMLLNENVNDFDIYFRTPDVAERVAHYYVGRLLENPPPCFKSDESRKVEVTVEREGDRVRVNVKSAGIAGEVPQADYQYFEQIQGAEEQASASAAYIAQATANMEEMDEHGADDLDNTGTEDKERYRPLFVTSNAISLAKKVQLVLRFTGEPEQIHENYDFVHCTNYWTSWNSRLVLRPEALEAILTKELRYVGSLYPICSMIRTRKFIARGWTINAGQFVKMAWQVGQLDLEDVNVLEEQLVGVDAAYFMQLIAELKKTDTPERVDGTYLMTLIDRLF